MNEEPTNEEWDAEADKWYYDLGKLGKQVEANRGNYRHLARRNLAVAIIGLLSVLVLAYVTQRQESQIRQNEQRAERNVFAQCQVANRNAVALNTTLDQIEMAVKINPNYTEATRNEFLAVYNSAKAKLPVCGPEPK